MSAMLPVDPDYETNRRTDGYSDFAELKRQGCVRDKQGRIISITKPHNQWSALERDRLFQAYCRIASAYSDAARHAWIADEARKLGMSVTRAVDIINEGNGEWREHNMMWWRGVSI